MTQTKLEEIEHFGGEKIAEAIKKVRKGDIIIEPGFDGVFGKVKIWKEEKGPLMAEVKEDREQMSLF